MSSDKHQSAKTYVVMNREHPITLAEQFRALACGLREQAARLASPAQKIECERLAECYASLAEEHDLPSQGSLQPP